MVGNLFIYLLYGVGAVLRTREKDTIFIIYTMRREHQLSKCHQLMVRIYRKPSPQPPRRVKQTLIVVDLRAASKV